MKTSRVVLGIAAGVAVGAALGLLLAPDSGEKTRKKIMKKSKAFADDMKSRVDHLVNGMSSRASEVEEELQEAKRIISNATKKATS